MRGRISEPFVGWILATLGVAPYEDTAPILGRELLDLGQAIRRMKIERTVLAALSKTEELLPQAVVSLPDKYELCTPSKSDIAQAKDWSLNWEENFGSWCDEQRRLGVAIRSGDVLCGLAIGRFHKNMSFVGFTMMEGNPSKEHPFKGHVLDTVELFGLICAQAVGANELRLFNPLEGVIPYYLNCGYELVAGNPPYCVKQV